jgi:F420-dependent oxidoreductase-like protein
MRIGLAVDGAVPLPAVLEQIEQAAAAGFAAAWLGEVGAWDPLTVFAALGSRAPGIELGTAVMATFARHPLAMAAQALATQAAIGDRLVLGLGPSHQVVVEGRLALEWDRPLLRVREYLDVLLPVLDGVEVDVRGTTTGATGGVVAPGAARPPVLLAAHGPRMLGLAGERADGVITLWARPRYVADFIVPAVEGAAGGKTTRLVVGVNACVTADPDAARGDVAERLGIAAGLPSYRGSLDRQGLDGIEDTIVAGDESVVARAVRDYAEAGATELIVFPSGPPSDRARTIAVFAQLASAAGSCA